MGEIFEIVTFMSWKDPLIFLVFFCFRPASPGGNGLKNSHQGVVTHSFQL